MILFGLLGAKALFLLYGWLLCAILASYLAERKGYSEKTGLASGLLLYVIGPIIWLVMPARAGSKWKRLGVVGRGEGRSTPPDA